MPRRLIFAACTMLLTTLVFAQDSPAASIEFYGTIQSINSTALVINGQLADISTAQINAPLVVGMVVRAQGMIALDGSITARQIDPIAPGLIPGIVELSGIVSELEDTALRVGGQNVDMSSAQISGVPLVGQFVRVYALQTAPGVWTARSLIASPIPAVVVTPEVLLTDGTDEVAAPVTTPDVIPPAQTPGVSEDFRIEGTLQAVDGNTITVDGSRFFIGSARIDGALSVGARVRLEIRIVNGEWVLDEISNRDGDSGGESSGGSGGSGSDNSGHGGGSSGSGDDNSGHDG